MPVSTLTIVITALTTLAVTVCAGLLLDYFRKARHPSVGYSAKDAVPIKIGDIFVGAYVVTLVNTSKGVVKDLKCHIDAAPAKP